MTTINRRGSVRLQGSSAQVTTAELIVQLMVAGHAGAVLMRLVKQRY